jgi:hypothetical protein
MNRLLAAAALVALLGACYPVSVEWKSKYFAPPKTTIDELKTRRNQIDLKHDDGTIQRLGYIHEFEYVPIGHRPGRFPGLSESFELYRIYDDELRIYGRMDSDGSWYVYPKPGVEVFKGKHTLLDGLRVLFSLRGGANVYLSPIDPYRGG